MPTNGYVQKYKKCTKAYVNNWMPTYIGDPGGEGLMTQSSSPTPSTLAQIKKLL